ncbi:hypothetical protein BZM27_06395 [Paraburkholderia steynii]|uniref:Uncharacterized protein n=1 Tax=Paraburkholderia steynii TaxID=1245441 RepID=A0A4V2NHL2_9BURK|nr:hypothetical protein BZM27_06395 [Paraburkholderia steynii]
MKLTCRACGWHRVYRPHSDVLLILGACEACGSEDLDIRPARPFDSPGTLARWLLDRLGGRSRTRF